MAGLDGHPRVYRDIFPSITAREHKDPRMIMEVITYEIPQKVRVRKYPVDCIKLCETLREYKEKVGLSNRKISEQLNLPITKVEHWFRKDSSFAIPDEDVWFEIKKLMNIETTEFDESIMTFEEKECVFEKGNRIYDSKGISPTIICGDADLKILERVNNLEVRQIGNCMENGNRKNPNQGRVYDQDYLSPTLTDMQGGGRQPMIIESQYRIRKLTPKECWRIMDFSDEDFEKAAEVNSNTQLYKQAGNSICRNVLVAIFGQMLPGKEDVYKGM